MNSKRKRILWRVIAILLVAAAIWVVFGNTTVGLTTYTIPESNLPTAFDGYRIAHISDLHNSLLWKQAVAQLHKAQPDIICVTGDLVDAHRTDIAAALAFAAEAVKIAPCYYVIGNHETALPQDTLRELIDGLTVLGVTVLMDETLFLSRGDAQISLSGHAWGSTDNVGALTDFDGYRILLTHDPDPKEFDNYAAAEYDLVLAGHLHGGQFRIPFLGGLYVPSQGLFPENDAGITTHGCTDMVVSRGIGNSSFPLRLNNRPEVVLIELTA